MRDVLYLVERAARMKADISFPDELIKALAQAVADQVIASLKPSLVNIAPKAQADGGKLGDNIGGDCSLKRGQHSEDPNSSLPQSGYLRLKEVLALIPVSKSTWWEGVRKGRFPKPTKKFGPRITAWDVKDIRPLLEKES